MTAQSDKTGRPSLVRSLLRLSRSPVALLLAGAVIFALVALPAYNRVAGLFGTTRDRRAVLEIIRSEKLMFLVTSRIVTQLVVESTENNLLLGTREGFLIGKVSIYYGIDLTALPESAVGREGAAIVVTVPEPKILDFATDLESIRFISKESGLQRIWGLVAGRDTRAELEKIFQAEAERFVKDNSMVPDRAELLDRLRSYAPTLAGRVGMEVEFR